MSARLKRFALWFAIGLVLAIPVFGIAQEAESESESEAYAMDIDGRKTWTIRYGLGDALGLAGAGLASGQLTLEQTLTVDITGEALSVLTIEAHFDDRQSENLQFLAMYLDTERLDGVLGDFSALGIGGFASYGKKMKGLQLEYTMGEAMLTGMAARLEGISESKTFVGQRARDEVTYTAFTSGTPSQPRPYKRRIDGLYAYPLTAFYVEEFSSVALDFDPSADLDGVLAEYDLGFLGDGLAETEPYDLEEWEFQVIGGEGEQVLLLQSSLLALIRDRLEAAIDAYNEEQDLTGSEAKQYPFSRGTDYETTFLELIAIHTRVAVDDDRRPVLDAVRRRYFDLGRDGVVASSAGIEVSDDGTRFDSIESVERPEFSAEILSDEGILVVDFPETFFSETSALRVEFDYTVTGGVFMLDISIIPGSDRVTVNGALLERDVDYMLDYDVGMLVLLGEVGESDVIRVEYERFAGGPFGAGADYATYFYGLILDWPISDLLEIRATWLRSVEDPASATDPDSVKTMPNRHTVAGVSGAIRLEDFTSDFRIAYSHDQFPFDDNARISLPNQIEAIVAAGDFLFFGHRSGLTAKRGDDWATYGPGHGMAGRSVRALAQGDERLVVGTDTGLSVVWLDGSAPLDRVTNWTNYYAEESGGLPNASVRSLLLDGDTLWIGTDDGLASVPIEQMSESQAWLRSVGVDLGSVYALAIDEGTVYAGTDDGLYRYDPGTPDWVLVPGTEGQRIHDLLVSDGMLYVASDHGLRGFRTGIDAGWLLLGREVFCVAAGEDGLIYGTDAGWVDEDGVVYLPDVAVTAIHDVEERLWIGTRASAEYELVIWSYGSVASGYSQDETGIDGRDPQGFIDAVAADHTVEGTMGRASFYRNADGYTLSGGFETIAPSYRALGSRGRSDRTEWDLAGTWILGPEADLYTAHQVELAGLRGEDAEGWMRNDLSLNWSFGPDVSIHAHQESRNDDAQSAGPELSVGSYSVSWRDTYFVDRLRGGITWTDTYTTQPDLGAPRRDNRLSFDAQARLLPSWTANVSWSRPIRAHEEEWSGSESFVLRSGWSNAWEMLGVAVDYALNGSRPIPCGVEQRDHTLEVDVDGTAFETNGWMITPQAEFGATSDETSVDVNGRISARGKAGDLSLQASLRGELTGIGEAVLREHEKLSLSGSYSGGPQDLRATLTYGLDRNVAIYEAQRQVTFGHALSGRATWSPVPSQYEELSFTWTHKGGAANRQTIARVENSYRVDLTAWTTSLQSASGSGYPILDVRVDSDFHYRYVDERPDFDATTTCRLHVALSQTWSASFGASYLGGTGSSGVFYHSMWLEATVAIDF